MILVTGANGAFGTAAIDFLMKKLPANQIAALVRSDEKGAAFKAKGVEIRIGDYDNVASLVNAFQGVDKLLFVSGSDIANRNQQHLNVVEAAKTANVGHVVYTSFMRRNETESSPIAFISKSHLTAEEALKDSGLSYTFLKNGLYFDILPTFMGEQVIDSGVIFQPAGEGKSAFVLRKDLAEATANILTSEGHAGKTYNLTGTTAVSYGDIAADLTDITGKSITHISPTKEVYRSELEKAGVPEMYITLLGAFAEAIKQGEFEDVSNDLPGLLGRQPVLAKDYLRQVYGN